MILAFESACESQAVITIKFLNLLRRDASSVLDLDQTGLSVLHADIKQPLMTGQICLMTQVEDADGLAHTLEHLIFMGSKKYPYKVGQANDKSITLFFFTLLVSFSFMYAFSPSMLVPSSRPSIIEY